MRVTKGQPGQPKVGSTIGGVRPGDKDLSSRLVEALSHLGVRWAFGVSGGGIARVWRALIEGVNQVHFRDERGAAFAAVEASLATRSPVVVFTTTGPGITNAISGLAAARYEGARVLLLSPRTSPAQRELVAVQETPGMMPSADLFFPGWLFDDAFLIDAAEQLQTCIRRLGHRLQMPGSYVAHLSIAVSVQNASVPWEPGSRAAVYAGSPDPQAVQRVAEMLNGKGFFLWVGHGARHAYPQVRELVAKTGAPVVATPRGKGVLSDRDRHLLMVSGLGGHREPMRTLAEYRPDMALVLGSRLGEASGGWDQGMLPPGGLIQVDESPGFTGTAGGRISVAVQGDIGRTLDLLTPLLEGTRLAPRFPSPYPAFPQARHLQGVRPPYLMGSLERQLIARDCPIMVEPGSAMAWTTHWMKVPEPGLLRLPSQFGSMGHMTCGVVGRALSTGRPAACLTGDGSMLMAEEVHTAVDTGAPAIWVVMNDAKYAMVEAGMAATAPFGSEARFARCDFERLATGWGAGGISVEEEADLDAALRIAVECGGPFVVDVRVDTTQLAPFGARLETLAKQQGRKR